MKRLIILSMLIMTGCAVKRQPHFSARQCPPYAALEHRTCTRFDHATKKMVDYKCDVCRVLDEKGYVTPDEPFAVGTDIYDADGDEGAAADHSKKQSFIDRLLRRRVKTGSRDDD